MKISGADLPPPSCRLDFRCRSWQERQQNRKEKRKVLKGKRACANRLKVRATFVAVKVFAVAAHAENAEHVCVSGLGKGADFLRARAVAVRALDLGRAGGRGGFAGGFFGIPSRLNSSASGLTPFPELGRARVVF